MSEGGGGGIGLGTISLIGTGGGGGSSGLATAASVLALRTQRSEAALRNIAAVGGFEAAVENLDEKTRREYRKWLTADRSGVLQALGYDIRQISDAIQPGRYPTVTVSPAEIDQRLIDAGVFRALPGTAGSPPIAPPPSGGGVVETVNRYLQLATSGLQSGLQLRSLYDAIRGLWGRSPSIVRTLPVAYGGQPKMGYIDTTVNAFANLASAAAPIIQAFTGQPPIYYPSAMAGAYPGATSIGTGLTPSAVPPGWVPITPGSTTLPTSVPTTGIVPASWDIPGIDVVNPIQPQGTSAALGAGSCIVPQAKKSTVGWPKRVQFPTTTPSGNSQVKTYVDMGAPVLYAGDLAACRRVDRVARRLDKYRRHARRPR